MNLSTLARRMGIFLHDNAPAILTATAVAGVVGTVVLAVRATPTAIQYIHEAETDFATDEGPYKTTAVDKVKLTWRLYLPAALSGAATIAAIIAANTTHSRRNAALMSVYTLTDRAYKEYREEMALAHGEKAEEAIHDKVAERHIRDNPVSENSVIITSGGDSLCYDPLSGRYFKCDIETIRKAVNDINLSALNHMYVSHNDFYRAVGLPTIDLGEDLGWTTDNRMEIRFSSILTEEQKPALYLDYTVHPIRDYWKIN